jgi:hypothetical protein
VGYGKECFSHNSVTDIKDMKKKTEAAVSSTVTDRLQHFCAAAQGTGKVQSVAKAQRGSRGISTPSLTSALDGRWVINATSRPLYLREREQ